MPANSLRQASLIPATTYNTVGLVNAATYAFLANGAGLVRLTAFDAPTVLSAIQEGNGIYFIPPDANNLVLQISAAALTTGAGYSMTVNNVFYPLLTTAGGTSCFSSGLAAVTITASANSINRYALRLTGAADTTTAVNRVVIPTITATTWAASAGGVTIQLEAF